MKLRIMSVIMVVLIFVSGVQIVFAMENEENMEPLEKWNSLVVYDGSFEEIEFDPTDMEAVSGERSINKTITIPVVGMSSLISFDMDKYNLTTDTYDEFITNSVVYESSDLDVVVAYDGRILARGTGEAVVTVKVGNLEERINVKVGKEISQELVEQVMECLDVDERNSETAARSAIVQKGADMVSCIWKPTSNLVGWNAKYTYKANEYQYGIPYSQAYNGMCDEAEFLESMSNGDFYTTYYNSAGDVMPKYGNDCSAFVAICWGVDLQWGW